MVLYVNYTSIKLEEKKEITHPFNVPCAEMGSMHK